MDEIWDWLSMCLFFFNIRHKVYNVLITLSFLAGDLFAEMTPFSLWPNYFLKSNPFFLPMMQHVGYSNSYTVHLPFIH